MHHLVIALSLTPYFLPNFTNDVSLISFFNVCLFGLSTFLLALETHVLQYLLLLNISFPQILQNLCFLDLNFIISFDLFSSKEDTKTTESNKPLWISLWQFEQTNIHFFDSFISSYNNLQFPFETLNNFSSGLIWWNSNAQIHLLYPQIEHLLPCI